MGIKSLLLLTLSAVASAAPREKGKEPRDATYDYVIVGGGTAGNALAARLSQGLPSAAILVVEAGPSAPNELRINVPGMKGSTLGTVYDWNFTTVAQSGLRNRTVGTNRGKVLGGSSALNLMVWDRAAAPEYDAWEKAGNVGWNWRTMLPAMIKSENFTGKNTATYGSKGVGEHGPLKAVVNRRVPAHQDAWIPTVVATTDIPTNLESLAGKPIGVEFQPSSIDATRYVRSYSTNAYLPLGGQNLEVLTGATVVKIELKKEGSKQRATGVTLANGTTILAAREVILCAGTVQSPQLLELSGIGQKSILTAANIPQVIDLPGVGENLQDHIRVQVSYQLKENYTSFDRLRYDSPYAAQQLDLWRAGQPSLYDYTASGYIFANWEQVAGRKKASELKSLARNAIGSSRHPADVHKLAFLDEPIIPQLEVIFSDGYTGVKGYPALGTPLYGQGFFTLIAGLMHPLSRGSIHVNPADKLGKPLIDPKYLSNEADIVALIESIKFCRKLALAEPLRSTWVAEYEPGLERVTTDAEWRDFVLNTTLSIFHPTGTCSMLPKSKGGVVDSALKVYGTTNLRVVDASVMAVQLSAHIQTAVYGIAERAAEIIVKEARAAH